MNRLNQEIRDCLRGCDPLMGLRARGLLPVHTEQSQNEYMLSQAKRILLYKLPVAKSELFRLQRLRAKAEVGEIREPFTSMYMAAAQRVAGRKPATQLAAVEVLISNQINQCRRLIRSARMLRIASCDVD